MLLCKSTSIFTSFIVKLSSPTFNTSNATPPLSFNTTDGAVGMHILRRVVRDGIQVGDIIPLDHIHSPAHLIPRFGKEANPHLTCHMSYDLSNKFWLNKYWNKEIFYALSLA